MSDIHEKGFCSAAPSFYAVLYAELRQVALNHGYALAIHGSLHRDLDLIAVPWTDSAAAEETLVKAITEAARGFIQSGNPEEKPHGRHAYTILLGGCSATIPPDQRATYIDLSVTPFPRAIPPME